MLLRYLKDESAFKMPAGIMLFSVSDIFRSLLPRTSQLTYGQPWVDFGELTGLACPSAFVDLRRLSVAYEAVNGNSDHPNSSSDVLCTSGWFPQQILPGGADKMMLSTAYFSPNRAPGETFVGYPRTFISLGGAEVFVEEVRELAEKMERNGVDVSLDVQVRVTWRDRPHV